MTTKNEIISFIRDINNQYQDMGFKIVSLFGSYARDEADDFSDIDLTYKINHDKFFKDNAYKKLEKLEEIKKLISKRFKTKVDFIPQNSKNRYIRENLQKEQILI